MLIKYKKPNLVGIPHKGGTFYMKPGVNKVEDGLWEEIVKGKALEHLIGGGFIEEMHVEAVSEEKPAAGEEEVSDTIANMKAGEAVGVVKETFDADLLNSWREDEDRATVLKAIDKQLEELESDESEEED